MTSLLDGIREFLTPAVLSRASADIGEPEDKISKGLMAAVPALLLSLANRSDDSSFMSQIAGLATGAADADPAVAATASGPDWLGKLLGGHVSSVTDGVARFAGLRGSSATSVLKLAAPLIMAFLGRLMRRENLDAAGLARRLRSERSTYMSAIPSGFDIDSMLPTAAGVRAVDTARHVDVPAAVAAAAPSRSRGWVTALVLAALGLGALAWWASRDRPVSVATTVGTATTKAVGTAGSALRTLTRSLPGNIDITVPAGGMEDRLIAFLSASGSPGTSLDFDRIEFETGSATLTPASQDQITAIAAVLRAYPNARVTVSGHTDNTGDESANVALSQARAEAVSAALTSAGVSTARLRSEGLGSRTPVADNRTEQGRAQNRRVVLLVQRG